MKATTLKPRAKSKRTTRLKAKAAVAKQVVKRDSLIRPWARKSALSLINALSSEPVTRLPKPVGAK